MINISVVIPTYNRERLIKNAIDSVLKQEGQGKDYEIYEIIISDDGSTDKTEDVIKEIKDKRIKFYRSERNLGAAAARNKGVQLAKGDWIAFQDSDDVWHSDKLKKQVEYLKQNPDMDMVSHPIRARFGDGEEITTNTVAYYDMVPYLAEMNYYDTPTILVRRDIFITLGGFDEGLKALEDWEFVLRFAHTNRIGMVPEVLIDSQMMSDGVSSGASAYYESRCKMIAKNKDILIAHDCLDNAIRSLFKHAEKNDVLVQVKRVLELSLMTAD